jgi:hypothetical protein
MLPRPFDDTFTSQPVHIEYLVQAPWWRHRRLDSQAPHVLPALLQQRDEVIDSKHNVANQFILSHVNVSDRDTHAKNLLQLELDCGLDFVDLVAEVVSVGDGGWELAG